MSVVHEWSVRLANEIAPDEVALAPILTEAFLRGGQDREELFSKSESVMGAFGFADMATVLPLVLSGIALVSPQLVNTLGSSLVSNYLACIKNALSLFEISKRSSAVPARLQLPADDSYMPLRQIADAVYNELRKNGRLSEEKCAVISFRVLKVLLEEPRGASSFVREVAKGS
jgi:hypothetical protein